MRSGRAGAAMLYLLIWASILGDPLTSIGGLSDSDIILVNHTGLYIARIEIGKLRIDEVKADEKILVSVTPTRHHVRLVFRGGADVDWPRFDFRGVHEIFFERIQNHIDAHFQ